MKSIRVMRRVQIVLVFLFVISIYFLLPYILHLIGVQAFVITTKSMVHKEENQAFFESFWKEKGVEPSELPVRYGIKPGDLIIQKQSQDYRLGDVITFKIEGSRIRQTHRIYEYNLTHFRDIEDKCITKEKSLEIVWLVVRGNLILKTNDPELAIRPDRIYQGPSLEACTHNWIPAYNIKGKVILVLPKAGLLYMILNPSS